MHDTVVPALVGLTGSEAVELGMRSGVVVVSDLADLATTSRPVVDQDPKAGFGVAPGSTIRVVLGPGGRPRPEPEPVTAPGPARELPVEPVVSA